MHIYPVFRAARARPSRAATPSDAWDRRAVRPARICISKCVSTANPSIPAVSWRPGKMFSKSSKSQRPVSPASATGAKKTPFSLIGGDVSITGDLSASVDLHIDGRIEGDITCAALVQGPDSHIMGHVIASSARLAGLV